MIIEDIKKEIVKGKKLLSVLIDPDKYTDEALYKALHIISKSHVNIVFVGGSLISSSIDHVLKIIRKEVKLPVILFPGSLLQISDNADGILLLSLISGRNPEYLISNHVAAAPLLKKSGLEIISTGYILIESGKTSSTQYVSNTLPIPAVKIDLVIATAIAGEMLGHKWIYLEAGSGALKTVPPDVVSEVKANITIPVIVGGGIGNAKQAQLLFQAGADMIVIGNALENHPELILEF